MNGVINVYKEKGYTSHDVVAKLRGILRQKKIGHTGTLDPQAEGVLPVCLGTATKLCDMLTDKTKEYTAKMQLGVTTDTLDLTGSILSTGEVTCTESEVLEVMNRFVGKSEQIPPMYSALKVNGKKLYELAREGKEVERKPRPIEIFSLKVCEIAFPYVTFSVHCSKGTYIRSLCHDMGQALGCGAAMAELVRTRVDRFALADALTLSEIERLRDEGKLLSKIVPVDSVFSHLAHVVVKNECRRLIDNGNAVYPSMFLEVKTKENMTELTKEDMKVRIYNEDGLFYGIYRYEATGRLFKPEKMFLSRT